MYMYHKITTLILHYVWRAYVCWRHGGWFGLHSCWCFSFILLSIKCFAFFCLSLLNIWIRHIVCIAQLRYIIWIEIARPVYVVFVFHYTMINIVSGFVLCISLHLFLSLSLSLFVFGSVLNLIKCVMAVSCVHCSQVYLCSHTQIK